jgi:glycopeptide antibiotics resistance protein
LKDATKKKIRRYGNILFLLYVLCLVYFLFFSEGYGRIAEGEYRYNLIPFLEIRRFWTYRKLLGTFAFYSNIFGNVLGFLPFGFILPVILPKMDNIVLILLAGFSLSLSVEVIQLITRVGCFDVDDLILNTLGALLGYLAFAVCNHARRKYYGKKI